MRGQLPYLSCPLHEFRTNDLKDCVAARKRNGLTSRIAFVGDSRIRYLLELFLYVYRDLDLLITTFKGETVTPELFLGETGKEYWIKYKHHFFVKSTKLKDLKFEFFWAPVLQENRNPDEHRVAGARDLLEEWANSNETLPDMIVLDSGTWGLIISKQEPLDTLVNHGVEAMKKLAPVLAQLATRTTVIFQLPDPIFEFVHHQFTKSSYEQQTNAMMNWLLTAYANLHPPNVIVWDSFLPVAHQQREDCMKLIHYLKNLDTLPSYPSVPQKITWQCYERMHTGFEGLTIGLQMLINHICNPFVDRLDVCCNKQI
ncbi:N-acetylneuraminate (7)9-O-acetyltransferase-like [Oratosquilla oratoria]|uniref:N-acetylneuraminate (7)9-O-acetyltransferase-like n=1 Tax=Oratosquilla oratoria TaxID=337810 RepID=UPI003F75C8F4